MKFKYSISIGIVTLSVFYSFALSTFASLDNRGCPSVYSEITAEHKTLLQEVASAKKYIATPDNGGKDSGAEQAMNDMILEASKAGISISIADWYRSYDDQVFTYFRTNGTNPITLCYRDGMSQSQRNEVKQQYIERASWSAPPGYSEHHSGKAVDFEPISQSFEATSAFTWLQANASKYGWELSYPKSQASSNGTSYEPWHWRYVGVGNTGKNQSVSNGTDPSDSSAAPKSTSTQSAEQASNREAGNYASYQSYTSFPGIGRVGNLCELVTALWNLGYLVLFISVLGMFIYGGYLYVTAGVNAGKVNQAKEIFTNTIIGLILGLSVFIIINIINPGLLRANCEVTQLGNGRGSSGQPTDGIITGNGSLTLLEVARQNSQGKRPDGYCYQHVANYIDAAGFCGIQKNGFNAAIPPGYYAEARQFAEYLNQGNNADQLGIRRLNISNIFQAPAGSIVVVRAGTPGTSHPTAGDISVASGQGQFYNGGEMGFVQSDFQQPNDYVLGVYVCK